ncbi:MAG: RNA methyltransferase [Betaproteobacteria bacterium]|nr:RNA methyltransferase [Betaproteobacteria bacterium]MDE2623284.1 RNA methyltransferase [Betaproteobacteria bacterium]
MQVIRSRDNPMAKALAQLAHSARYRRKQGETVLDGVHLVGSYLQAVGRPIAVAVSETGIRHPEIARLLEHPFMPSASVLTDVLFAECASVTAPVGIAAIVSIPQPPLAGLRDEPCLVLENIQDPGNLGTLLRSAAAAGICHVLLSQGCTLAWAPRVLRAGQGAHFQLQLHENVSLSDWAQHYSGRLVGAVMHDARPYWELDLKGGVALVIGNEGAGITQPIQALLRERACIPMTPGVESLNAAVAGSVLLFERVRQQAL